MKDIFTKLQNFLSDPSSTLALIGTFVVLVSSFFVTPDRFCLVMASFVAFLAVIAMRAIEVRLLNRLEDRENTIIDKYDELNDLMIERDSIKGAYKKKYDDAMGQLQAINNEYTKLAKQHNALGRDFSNLQKKYDDLVQANDVKPASHVTQPKNPSTATSKKAKYAEEDVIRIREEMKSAGLVPEKED